MKLITRRKKRSIKIKNLNIGKEFVIIAGPCAIESEEQFYKTALFVKECGAHILRAMIFKPRTSPYSFQGLGIKGLKIIKKVKKELDIPVVTEVLDSRNLKKLANVVDLLQIGARNMQNFNLLREVGKTNKPVILKRGLCATIEEWLNAAEYIIKEGNENIIFCERGIRTFARETRFTLDLSSIPIIKKLTNLPVIVDPSHAAGRRELVLPLAKAAKAIGSDGLMIEVHPNPKNALSDNKQQLNFKMFKKLMEELKGFNDN